MMDAATRPTERPILFSAPMVQSILAGKKTQTRRIVSSLRGFGRVSEFGPSDTAGYDWHFRDRRALWNDVSNDRLLDLCAYGAPGDQLWVRETWQAIHADTDPETGSGNGLHAAHDIPPGPADYWQVAYAADPEHAESREDRGFPWRPAIHMPRWASRVTFPAARRASHPACWPPWGGRHAHDYS